MLQIPLECYSDAGNYDRVVIQELLKEIAQTQQVDLNAKQRFKGWFNVALQRYQLRKPSSCDN